MQATPCKNCKATVGGSYCHACGQSVLSPSRSTWALCTEFFGEAVFSLRSKTWRTFGLLLAKPGELTRRYLAGARASQLPPIRTYLVLSLLVFFIAPPIPLPNPDTHQYEVGGQVVGERQEGLPVWGFSLPKADRFPGSWFPARTEQVRSRLLSIEDRHVFHSVIRSRLSAIVPNWIVVVVLSTALLLKLIGWRDKRPLFDHLLFSLHFNSFAFALVLILTVALKFLKRLGLDFPSPGPFAALPFLIVLGLYLSLRRVYGDSHPLTLLKAALLSGLFYAISAYFIPMLYHVALLTL